MDINGNDTLANEVLSTTGSQLNVPFSSGAQAFSGSFSTVAGDAAIDVYWGLGHAYDFFNLRWGWTPVGGWSGDWQCPFASERVDAYINDTVSPGNAKTTNPCNRIAFGMGYSEQDDAKVSLDIVGHEYAHLVLGLEASSYTPIETRALSESFSDMMSACIERYVMTDLGVQLPNGTDYWTIGENTSIDGWRSMSTPDVDYYDGTLGSNWQQAVDDARIYDMAGVPNKWFYYTVSGGSTMADGVPFAIPALGLGHGSQYCILRIALELFGSTSEASMLQAAQATIHAADELYPGSSAGLARAPCLACRRAIAGSTFGLCRGGYFH